ncbi:DUF4292 domain-containing protein [Lacinutrix sp. MedPE-SW]|uniref:DUF4292 domain-containing protein n=1 Tax=Lacinutrix sp. MedPE-SW TaxID=1860087 RepID=UPI000917F32C|nr:DUF4292 domain-containing protein [Lacinutrix sp. MedPE-SW]OIQ23550.1 MAG: deoxyuridine 5'-triphosphate nucleotidohydrolase [Lacinutrix sp. MedPE-SW]
MNIKNNALYILILITTLFFSCKSSKTVTANGELNANASAKNIIKNIDKNASSFKTLSGRLKIESIQESKSQSYTVSLRMEKDKVIWLSKLGIVRAIITPNRVAFYNKLDGTYFDGDFSYLSNLLGTDLDFNKVQNMIIGEPIFKVNTKEYEASVFNKSYLLQPKQQQDLFELFLLINPSHFKMDSQQIAQPKEARVLEINYDNYQEVDKEILPENIKIIAVENDEQLLINLELKNLSLDETLRFPFTIPSGYKAIELK